MGNDFDRGKDCRLIASVSQFPRTIVFPTQNGSGWSSLYFDQGVFPDSCRILLKYYTCITSKPNVL
ncbi:MAG: hypothetical protein KME16_20700 [Scytolyngbya sp. HA4215-MV1]|nr:hypothetical protein [Scytolyngbya sp. HA4215-MV1]